VLKCCKCAFNKYKRCGFSKINKRKINKSLTKKRELKIWDVVDVQLAEAAVQPAMDCQGAVKIMDHVVLVDAIN
jgi:hypothetical protein